MDQKTRQEKVVINKTEGRCNAMAKDPVCGMEVDETKAADTSDYKGQKYFFCAKGRQVAFDKVPEKYLGGDIGHSH